MRPFIRRYPEPITVSAEPVSAKPLRIPILKITHKSYNWNRRFIYLPSYTNCSLQLCYLDVFAEVLFYSHPGAEQTNNVCRSKIVHNINNLQVGYLLIVVYYEKILKCTVVTPFNRLNQTLSIYIHKYRVILVIKCKFIESFNASIF